MCPLCTSITYCYSHHILLSEILKSHFPQNKPGFTTSDINLLVTSCKFAFVNLIVQKTEAIRGFFQDQVLSYIHIYNIQTMQYAILRKK